MLNEPKRLARGQAIAEAIRAAYPEELALNQDPHPLDHRQVRRAYRVAKRIWLYVDDILFGEHEWSWLEKAIGIAICLFIGLVLVRVFVG